MDKPFIAIITASNLKTTSDCSPGTVLNLLDSIDISKYRVDIVLIDKFVPEDLQTTEEKLVNLPVYIPFDQVLKHKAISGIYSLDEFSFGEFSQKYQMAIVAVYNDLGEDGKIIGMLDLLGVPYFSPSLKVSAVCFDKSYTKAILNQAGVLTPDSFFVGKDKCSHHWIDSQILSKFEYPVVVKAVSSGNSWGVTVVKESNVLDEAIDHALTYSNEILVEKLIEGQEFTVGVIGDYVSPVALPSVQISYKNDFFDYTAKYDTTKSFEACPASISDMLERKLRQTAVDAYSAVKADSHARIDMMVDIDENVYVLDINSFPGLNSASLFPKELIVAGSSLDEFINREIDRKLSTRNGNQNNRR